MKSFRFVRLFSVFVFSTLLIVLAVAQSNPVAHAAQATTIPSIQQLSAEEEVQPFVLAALGQPMRAGSFTPRGAVASKGLSASRLQADGPDVAPAGPYMFMPSVPYNSGGECATSVAVADVNGDGKPDLVVTNEYQGSANCSNGVGPGEVSVLLGNGDGTFQAPVSYNSGGIFAFWVVIEDVNGDGHPDLIVANGCQNSGGQCDELEAPGGVGVLLGNGDGTFQPAVSYSSGGLDAVSVAIADVNGDGHPDLIVANMFGQVGVLLGNGDGTFRSPVSYDSGAWWSTSILIADLNGDGHPDVVVASHCVAYFSCFPGVVGVLLGNGDGTFQTSVIYNSTGCLALSVAVGDLNGDGRPDLVMANGAQGFCTQQNIGSTSVLLGNGDGTFQTPTGYNSGGDESVSVAIADVNGDGYPDLVVANACQSDADCNGNPNPGEVSALLGNGDGTFQAPGSYSSGGTTAEFVVVRDVNRDGKPDLLVINIYSNSVGVLLNNDGAPSTTTSLISSLNPANFKQVVTYTATVTSQSGGTVNGTVTFVDGSTTIGTLTLANNQAAYSTSYKTKGTHTITATYWGDLHVATGSQSAPLTEYIRNTNSKTVLTTSGSPSSIGQPVTFTATVTSKHGAIPDGELVTFTYLKAILGTSTTTDGVASFTTSFSKAKSYTIRATYAGDDSYEPSSGTVKQVVNP